MNQRLTVQLSTALAFGPTGIIWAFLPIHLRSLGASYLLIALVSLIPAVETIGLSPAWGGILDKTGRGNKILLISLLAQGIGFSVFPILKSPEEFVLVVSLMGLFSSSFIPVYAAMATLSNRQYGRAIGGFWTAALLGYASATLFGGILYQYLPVNCLLSITVLVSTSAFNSFFTLYLVDVLNGSRLTAGLAATGTTVLGVFAYRLVGPLNDKVGRKPIFILGAAGYAAYFTILYFVTNVVIVTVLWILPIYPLVQSASTALMSDYTSGADRGKGLGLLESAISLGGGLGPLAGGLIADAAQLQAVIVFSLVVALASVASSQIFLREKPRITIPGFD